MPTYRVAPEALDELRRMLHQRAYEFEDRPHQRFLARREGSVVNAYESGAVVTGGTKPLPPEIAAWLDARAAAPAPDKHPMPELPATHAGIDEAGKGDYFGPLVVAGVVVTRETGDALRALGVKDSKRLDNEQVLVLAKKIEATLPREAHDTLRISPMRYNTLHAKLHSVNRMLGWAHARVIENLVTANPRCTAALSDQFGDERLIQRALQEKGRAIRLFQVPKAERDIAVAAASVLARAEFLLEMRLMSARHDFPFPLGATHVDDAARAFAAARGPEALAQVAKAHFANTARVVDDPAAVHAAVDRAAPEG